MNGTQDSKLSGLDWVMIALVVIGALNWGLVGIFKFDLVAAIFGALSLISRLIYVIVALAGLYLVFAATRFRHDTSMQGQPRSV